MLFLNWEGEQEDRTGRSLDNSRKNLLAPSSQLLLYSFPRVCPIGICFSSRLSRSLSTRDGNKGTTLLPRYDWTNFDIRILRTTKKYTSNEEKNTAFLGVSSKSREDQAILSTYNVRRVSKGARDWLEAESVLKDDSVYLHSIKRG